MTSFFSQLEDLSNTTDTDPIQVAQVLSFNDIKQEVMLITPYGLYHYPMKNSLVIAQTMPNDNSTIIGTASDSNNRKKGLKPGEVVVGNTHASALIHFKQDGTISITTPNNVDINCSSLNATCATASITCPNISIEGNVTINGTLEVDGIDFSAHVHGGVQSGIGTTGGPE